MDQAAADGDTKPPFGGTMSTLNNHNFIGNLTRDPTLKPLPSGTKVAELSLGVDDAGNKRGDSGYFDLLVYAKPGEAAAQYLKKGSRVAFHGEARFNHWTDNDGNTRSRIRFVGNVQFLDRRTPQDEAAANAIAELTADADEPEGDEIPF
ncbi:MAG: single-stranded DNA-binding protein [Trebonia sp.]